MIRADWLATYDEIDRSAGGQVVQSWDTASILEIDDGSIKTPAEDAAEYLSRHGIKPVIRREQSTIDLPSAMILDAIEEIHAAYLVMGGFGHGRFMESMFGGVGKRMLSECPVPLFLAH